MIIITFTQLRGQEYVGLYSISIYTPPRCDAFAHVAVLQPQTRQNLASQLLLFIPKSGPEDDETL
jgi:hypothetical protein